MRKSLLLIFYVNPLPFYRKFHQRVSKLLSKPAFINLFAPLSMIKKFRENFIYILGNLQNGLGLGECRFDAGNCYQSDDIRLLHYITIFSLQAH